MRKKRKFIIFGSFSPFFTKDWAKERSLKSEKKSFKRSIAILSPSLSHTHTLSLTLTLSLSLSLSHIHTHSLSPLSLSRSVYSLHFFPLFTLQLVYLSNDRDCCKNHIYGFVLNLGFQTMIEGSNQSRDIGRYLKWYLIPDMIQWPVEVTVFLDSIQNPTQVSTWASYMLCWHAAAITGHCEVL